MKHVSKRALISGAIELKDGDDDPNAIVQKALDDLQKSVDERLKAIEGKADAATVAELEKKLADAQKRADALELKMQRPGAHQTKDERAEVEKKAFATFLRHGREALGADEIKSLRVSDDTQGGYLAPSEFSREVDKNLIQLNPIRSVARVGSTASGSVIIPRRTDEPVAAWVGELEARTETGSTYGQIEINIHELAGYVDVSRRLLEDSAVDIASEVAFDVAEEVARLEGVAFVSGDGNKKPTGFMSDADVGYTPGGDASLIKADGLISLYYSLHPAYRQRGVWIMNSSTVAAVRKLKDASTGLYIWQPALQESTPPTILGRPVIEAPSMPDVAGNAYPIAFGDFAAGYRIYDRVGISLLRDEYSVATSGLVRFHFRKRVGGGTVRAEAIRKLKIATS